MAFIPEIFFTEYQSWINACAPLGTGSGLMSVGGPSNIKWKSNDQKMTNGICEHSIFIR